MRKIALPFCNKGISDIVLQFTHTLKQSRYLSNNKTIICPFNKEKLIHTGFWSFAADAYQSVHVLVYRMVSRVV